MHWEILFQCVKKYYSDAWGDTFQCIGEYYSNAFRAIISMLRVVLFQCMWSNIIPMHREIVFQSIDNGFPLFLIMLLQCIGKYCYNVLRILL